MCGKELLQKYAWKVCHQEVCLESNASTEVSVKGIPPKVYVGSTASRRTYLWKGMPQEVQYVWKGIPLEVQYVWKGMLL